MDDPQLSKLEGLLRETAGEFRYPPIPDIRGNVLLRLKPAPAKRPAGAHKLVWVLVVLVAVAAGLLAAPPVRAQILEFFQVGMVKIFQAQPRGTPVPLLEPDPPSPPAALIPSLQSISGETDLQNAQDRVPFQIRLPGYPGDLGKPDLVFLQDMAGPLVVLVWLDPNEPEKVRISLQVVGPGSFAIEKSMPRTIEWTEVNGQPAVWAEGPYILHMKNGSLESYRLIDGHVLIWEEGELTYRLETDLPLEEAVRVAESLR